MDLKSSHRGSQADLALGTGGKTRPSVLQETRKHPSGASQTCDFLPESALPGSEHFAQNEASSSLLSERASNIAGYWQKYILLLRGGNEIVNHKEKPNLGFMEALGL